MGSLIGHVAPGSGFLLIGLWHLFNHIKHFSLSPKSYRCLPWFPFPKIRHLELLLLAAGSSISIAMELFIGPDRHQPLDPDLSIPSNHLQNFEHSSISLAFLLYSAIAIALDRARPTLPAAEPLTALALSAAFAQQLLLFQVHSADHMGVEGRYHWILQLVVAVSLFTTLLGVGHPHSFPLGFVRSSSIALQGVWFVTMGFALWTPALIPKGCFMNLEVGHTVVRCRTDAALHRAKSLVNILFSWIFVAVVAFSMILYLLLSRSYAHPPEYFKASPHEDDDSEDFDLLEDSDKRSSFVSLESGIGNADLGR